MIKFFLCPFPWKPEFFWINLAKTWHLRHSAGSLVAVNTYFEAPERVAALILVAPAILAPITAPKVLKGNQMGRESQLEEESLSPNGSGNPFIQLYNILSKFTKTIVDAITGLMKGMAVMINSLYKKFLSSILRSAFALTLVNFLLHDFVPLE